MEAEKATKFVQEIQRETKGLRNNGELIGSPRDGPQLRRKLETQRQKVSNAETKLQGLLRAASHGDRVWDEINGNYRQAKKEFDQVSLNVKKKEKEYPMGGAGGGGGGGSIYASEGAGPDRGSGSHAGGSNDVQINMHEFKRVDMSELATEEALQHEKYQGVVEIQQDMTELNSAYKEFQDLVQDQGQGIDAMENNVVKAKSSVEKGTTDLQGAGDYQKSARKKMCIMLIILAIIIAIVVVVVVVMKA